MAKGDSKAKVECSQREAKLAQALRANLRRRKRGDEAKPQEGPKDSD